MQSAFGAAGGYILTYALFWVPTDVAYVACFVVYIRKAFGAT